MAPRLLLLAAVLLAAGAAPALAQGAIAWVEVELALDEAGGRRSPTRPAGAPPGRCTASTSRARRRAPLPRRRGGAARTAGTSRSRSRRSRASGGTSCSRAASAWGPGEATYTFSYDADLAAAGLVAVTRPPDGPPLIVFNWSPVEWDEPLEHETLVVRFASVPAPRAGTLSLEDAAAAGLRTEPWVNERYRITYRGEGDPPTLWVRFHQERVPARGEPPRPALPPRRPLRRAWRGRPERRAGGAAGRGGAAARRGPRARCWRRATVVLPLLLALGLVSLGLAGRKLKGLARAHATAPDVLWERDDWEPPRLRLSTFRKPGKVAELSDLEALTLLGLPFQVILAMVLDLLVARGRLRREDADGALRLARAGTAARRRPLPALRLEGARRGARAAARGTRRPPRRAARRDRAAQGLGRGPRRHARALPAPLRGALPRRRRRGRPALRHARRDDADYYPWWVSSHHADGPGVWRGDGPAPFAGGGGGFGGGGATGSFTRRSPRSGRRRPGVDGRLRAGGPRRAYEHARLPQRLSLGLSLGLPQRLPLGAATAPATRPVTAPVTRPASRGDRIEPPSSTAAETASLQLPLPRRGDARRFLAAGALFAAGLALAPRLPGRWLQRRASRSSSPATCRSGCGRRRTPRAAPRRRTRRSGSRSRTTGSSGCWRTSAAASAGTRRPGTSPTDRAWSLLAVLLARSPSSPSSSGRRSGPDALFRVAVAVPFLFVPLWFNGMRTIWNPSELRKKGEALAMARAAAEGAARQGLRLRPDARAARGPPGPLPRRRAADAAPGARGRLGVPRRAGPGGDQQRAGEGLPLPLRRRPRQGRASASPEGRPAARRRGGPGLRVRGEGGRPLSGDPPARGQGRRLAHRAGADRRDRRRGARAAARGAARERRGTPA